MFLYRHIDAPYIIIGMHRSGTSFLSRVLEHAGIGMGAQKDHNNEAIHFLSLNQKTFAAEGCNWLEPRVPEKKNWKLVHKMQLYVEHFKYYGIRYIWVKLFKQKPWGWKDPRNTYTLQMWLSLYPKAKVIHVYRNGVDVANSLYNRNQKEGEVHDERLDDVAFGFKLWEQYISQAFSYNELLKDRIIHVQYEKLMNHDKQEISRLERFTKTKLHSIITEMAEQRVANTIDSSLEDLASTNHWMQKLGYVKTAADA